MNKKMKIKTCPFKPGDNVIYSPTDIGRGRSVMTDLGDLEPGGTYKVARVERDTFVVVEGFERSVTGGLHWTEFVLVG